jgi:hypothetical protein
MWPGVYEEFCITFVILYRLLDSNNLKILSIAACQALYSSQTTKLPNFLLLSIDHHGTLQPLAANYVLTYVTQSTVFLANISKGWFLIVGDFNIRYEHFSRVGLFVFQTDSQ